MTPINEMTALRLQSPQLAESIGRRAARCARLSGSRNEVAIATQRDRTTVSRWYRGDDTHSPFANSIAFKVRLASADAAQAWDLLIEEECAVTQVEIEAASTAALLKRGTELEEQIVESAMQDIRAISNDVARENRELAGIRAKAGARLRREYAAIQDELSRAKRVAEARELSPRPVRLEIR